METEKSTDTGLESPVDADIDIHKQKCKEHTDENQSFYCEKHYVCICGRCVFSNHFGCLDTVVDLNNVQHDIEHVNKSVSSLQELDEEIDHIIAEIDENRRLNDKCRSSFANDINEFHGACVQQLKMLMTKAEKESDNLHKQNTDVLDETELKCKEHKQVLRQRIEHLDELEHNKHYRHLFVALKRMGENIDSLKENNIKCRHENYIKEYEFVRNLKFAKLIEEEDHIGALTIACDGSEEVIELVEENVSALTYERMRDEQNERKTPDKKGNAKRDLIEHENLQRIQCEYDERLKELEECIRKRDEMHRQKKIQYDKQLKCLQEKEMTISKQEKSINFEKEKCESMKREHEQKIKKLQEELVVSEQKIKPLQEHENELYLKKSNTNKV